MMMVPPPAMVMPPMVMPAMAMLMMVVPGMAAMILSRFTGSGGFAIAGVRVLIV